MFDTVLEFRNNKIRKSYLGLLSMILFIEGYIASSNSVVIPFVKIYFNLNFTQAMLINWAYFLSFLLFSVGAGKCIQRYGFIKTILMGLVVSTIGCFIVILLRFQNYYPVFLFCIFIISFGVVITGTSINPYVCLIEQVYHMPGTLSFMHALNSLGTLISPWLARSILFSSHDFLKNVSALEIFYGLTMGLLMVLLISLYKYRQSEILFNVPQEQFIKDKKFIMGCIAIFVYVGCEVSIASMLVSYISDVNKISISLASEWIPFYWGGMLFGRASVSFLGRHFRVDYLIFSFALLAISLLINITIDSNYKSFLFVLIIGLSNSLMFPSLYKLTLANHLHRSKKISGYLNSAVVGGGIIPLFQGFFADYIGVRKSFAILIPFYVYLAWYARIAQKQ